MDLGSQVSTGVSSVPAGLGLSRRSFLRAPIPSPGEVICTAQESLEDCGRVHLVAFWGIGLKEGANGEERRSFAHLKLLCSTVGAAFCAPTRLSLLFADTHAHVNQIPADICQLYREDIARLASDFQFELVLLSTIPRMPNPELGTTNLPPKVFERKTRYIRAAEKFGSRETARERVERYVRLRLAERGPIKSSFPNAILLSGDRPSDSFLLPNLSTVFVYFGGPGSNHKPWLSRPMGGPE